MLSSTCLDTGGCPHTAVRDDVSQNLDALERVMTKFHPDLLFVESGEATWLRSSARSADVTIVIDVRVETRLRAKAAPLVGADLDVIPGGFVGRSLPVRPGHQ